MRSFFTKKRSLAALAAVAVLAIAGGAFAAFTSSGSGSGNAAVGTDAGGNWSVTQASETGGPLFPDPAGTGSLVGNGANVETLTYNVTNNAKGSLLLASVTAEVAGAGGSAWSFTDAANDPACTASDFSINGQPVGQSATDTTLKGDYNAGVTTGNSTFKIEMIDNGKNQNSCQGQNPPIYYTAN